MIELEGVRATEFIRKITGRHLCCWKQLIGRHTGQFYDRTSTAFVLNSNEPAEDNWVAAREIIIYVREQQLTLSDTKIGKELAKLGLTKGIRKVGGKSTSIWNGIK